MKIDDITPAKAGFQSKKLDSRSFGFAQDGFRGNDKYTFRNRYYLSLPRQSHRTFIGFQFKALRGHLNVELVLRRIIFPQNALDLANKKCL